MSEQQRESGAEAERTKRGGERKAKKAGIGWWSAGEMAGEGGVHSMRTERTHKRERGHQRQGEEREKGKEGVAYFMPGKAHLINKERSRVIMTEI